MTYREIAKMMFGKKVEEREDFERILFYIGEYDNNNGSRALQFPDAETQTDIEDFDIVGLEDKMNMNGISNY